MWPTFWLSSSELVHETRLKAIWIYLHTFKNQITMLILGLDGAWFAHVDSWATGPNWKIFSSSALKHRKKGDETERRNEDHDRPLLPLLAVRVNWVLLLILLPFLWICEAPFRPYPGRNKLTKSEIGAFIAFTGWSQQCVFVGDQSEEGGSDRDTLHQAFSELEVRTFLFFWTGETCQWEPWLGCCSQWQLQQSKGEPRCQTFRFPCGWFFLGLTPPAGCAVWAQIFASSYHDSMLGRCWPWSYVGSKLGHVGCMLGLRGALVGQRRLMFGQNWG